jgi:hypothetical protein
MWFLKYFIVWIYCCLPFSLRKRKFFRYRNPLITVFDVAFYLLKTMLLLLLKILVACFSLIIPISIRSKTV